MFCFLCANHKFKKVFEFKTRQVYCIYEAFQGVLVEGDIAPKLQKMWRQSCSRTSTADRNLQKKRQHLRQRLSIFNFDKVTTFSFVILTATDPTRPAWLWSLPLGLLFLVQIKTIFIKSLNKPLFNTCHTVSVLLPFVVQRSTRSHALVMLVCRGR